MEQDNNKIETTTLSGKGFKLVPLKREYLSIIHEWESDISSLYLWTIRKDILSEGEYNEIFSSRLNGYYHVFLLILDSDSKPVGFIYSYDVNFVDGFAFVTTFIKPTSRKSGIGAKAGLLFYNYLFSYYPLSKVYCDVFEYNEYSLSTLKHAGFVLEGTFKKHRFFKGNHYSLYRLSLYRVIFYEKFSTMIQNLSFNDIK